MDSFLHALNNGPLLFDGAMGSLLYQRGVFHTRSYDELNLSQPELIRAIHREYVEAGADVIETNTFGANRLMLARHGHTDRSAEINRRAVELAKEVAGEHVFVAGAVGPTGINFPVATQSERDLARAALSDQIATLTEAGANLIVLETFSSIDRRAGNSPCRQSGRCPGLPRGRPSRLRRERP